MEGGGRSCSPVSSGGSCFLAGRNGPSSLACGVVYEQRQGSGRLSGALGCDFCGASGDDASGECRKLAFYRTDWKLLFPKVRKKNFSGAVWLCLVFLVALWCGKTERQQGFVIWNSFVAVPVSVAFLVMVRCIGRKTERKGAVSCGKEQKSGQRKSGGLNDKKHLDSRFVACWILLTLSGCSAGLEARIFVSVLTVPDGDTESLLAERQRTSTCTLDYSHTKAVILDTTLTQNPEQLDNVLETLLSRPEFAWNLLVFTGDEETLRRRMKRKATGPGAGSLL